jgi:hypothetical protein
VPDVHVPTLHDRPGGKSFSKLVLEVALISIGVFLGLAGERWRDHVHQRELADEALRRFRTEIEENRKAVAAIKDYHATLLAKLQAQFKVPASKRSGEGITLNGVRPVTFDRSAWDLAIATQSLQFIDPDLSFSLSNLYNVQNEASELRVGFLQSMYMTPPAVDAQHETAFFAALMLYYGDMAVYEPRLLKMYEAILPRIDKALGDTTTGR